MSGSDFGKKRLNVKLTEKEHADVLRLKHDFGVTVSDMIRRALSEEVQLRYGTSIKSRNRQVDSAQKPIIKFVSADPALVRNVAMIGNNLNQIAHWVNTYKSKIEAIKVQQLLLQVRAALDAIMPGKPDA